MTEIKCIVNDKNKISNWKIETQLLYVNYTSVIKNELHLTKQKTDGCNDKLKWSLKHSKSLQELSYIINE